MAIEHLVVDDHHIREGVDVRAVAVDDGRDALRGPLLDLAGPVDLHNVRDDHQQRIRARHVGGQKGLRGLAEPRLVGEQVATVAGPRAFDEARLVAHQLDAAGSRKRTRLGQIHAGRAADADLE